MRNYLLLRARLLGRLLRELGWWRLLLLGTLLGLSTVRALVVAAGSPTVVWVVPVVVAGLAWSFHRQREDITFLELMAPRFRPWLAAEYALLTLPVVLLLLGLGRVEAAGLTVALTAAVALAPPAKDKAGRFRRGSLFRSVAFEWVGGSRRGWLPLLWLALLGAAAATRYTATGPVLAIIGWLLVLLEVYGPAEPWTLLLPVLHARGQWLRSRVGWGLLYFGLTVAPLAAVLALSPAGVGGTIALLFWCAVVLTMVVLAKYAFYPHATLSRLTQAGAVVVGLSVVGSNPAYSALLAACFLGLMLKSYRRLAMYRYD
ncbi:hypothetical protein DNI29_08345 [Hymenobacter sediminis]|uniref:hypothetical protein n=1 Tax=Hymenobacter sediminis TaxID=2218621 RepID=UPI000F4E1F4C|nr:hypothetical protein [Hymenobacter sediminis]RPD48614.1 hypothetical protein DNI29_08345 [Hymenobacter sediminis]